MSGKECCPYFVGVVMAQRSESFCKESTTTKDLLLNGGNQGILMILQILLVWTSWFLYGVLVDGSSGYL